MIIIKARGHAISDEDLLAKDPDRYRARLDRRKQRKSNEAEGFGERQFYNDPETAEARKLLAGLKKWEASYGSGGPISSPEELDKRLQQAHGTQQRIFKEHWYRTAVLPRTWELYQKENEQPNAEPMVEPFTR
jgi:hypothetical protein